MIYSNGFCFTQTRQHGESVRQEQARTGKLLSHVFNCSLSAVGLVLLKWKVTSPIPEFYFTPSMFLLGLWLLRPLTHQLCIWRHFLVFVVISLELLVGHELQRSMWSAKQARNVTLWNGHTHWKSIWLDSAKTKHKPREKPTILSLQLHFCLKHLLSDDIGEFGRSCPARQIKFI